MASHYVAHDTILLKAEYSYYTAERNKKSRFAVEISGPTGTQKKTHGNVTIETIIPA